MRPRKNTFVSPEDANRDGKISENEMAAALKMLNPKISPETQPRNRPGMGWGWEVKWSAEKHLDSEIVNGKTSKQTWPKGSSILKSALYAMDSKATSPLDVIRQLEDRDIPPTGGIGRIWIQMQTTCLCLYGLLMFVLPSDCIGLCWDERKLACFQMEYRTLAGMGTKWNILSSSTPSGNLT